MNKLDKIVELQKEFAKLYDGGLTAVNDSDVQLKDSFFLEVFDNFDRYSNFYGDGVDKLVTEYKGCKFFCIAEGGNDEDE